MPKTGLGTGTKAREAQLSFIVYLSVRERVANVSNITVNFCSAKQFPLIHRRPGYKLRTHGGTEGRPEGVGECRRKISIQRRRKRGPPPLPPFAPLSRTFIYIET